MADTQSITSAEFSVRHHLLMVRRAAVAYARAHGHDMSRWTYDGTCECRKCGAIMIEDDASAFVDRHAVLYLGLLARNCSEMRLVACW